MLPLTIGMLLRRAGVRLPVGPLRRAPVRDGGMLLAAVGFVLLLLLPTDFSYPVFGAVLLLIGIVDGHVRLAEPRGGDEQPPAPSDRGAGGAMNQTFQNSAQVLSIGIFFTLMIVGLASTLPATLSAGLEAHGVAAATAHQVATLPPVSILFAAFLGYNPIEHLLGPHVLAGAPRARPGGADRAAPSSRS